MRHILFDLESDGLKPTVIWCVATMDITTGEEKFFGPDQIPEALEYLASADTLIGHNIYAYDLWVLFNLHGFVFDGTVVDTLILSRLLKGTMKSHAMWYWGQALQNKKVEHEDWSAFTPEMRNRCISDVRLNKLIYDHIKKHQHFSKEISRLEHYVSGQLFKSRQRGFLLDVPRAEQLVRTMSVEHKQLTAELEELFPTLPKRGISYVEVPTEELHRPIKWTKSGDVSGAITRRFDSGVVWGCFSNVEWMEQNFNSDQFKITHLKRLGWEPVELTDKGNPRLGEEQLERLGESDIPEARKLARWDMLDRRITQVQSWLDNADSNGRVHCLITNPGTWTYRMTHSDPNLSAVPGRGKPFADECRKCWTVPDGYKLVGCDASGIQLRVLANGMGDEEYIAEVLDGDIHTKHQLAAELDTRNQAKTFIYAFLLGAGNKLCGEIAGEPPERQMKRGKELKEKFLTRIPSLGILIERLKTDVIRHDHITALDGRRVYCPDPHYALAGLLQADEAVIMKKAFEFWTKEAAHLDWHLVQWSHDEWQTEVREEHAQELAEIQERSFTLVQEYYQTKVRLDGEAKIGSDWSETH